MVARFVRDEEVAGSNPVTPTSRKAALARGYISDQGSDPFVATAQPRPVVILIDRLQPGEGAQ